MTTLQVHAKKATRALAGKDYQSLVRKLKVTFQAGRQRAQEAVRQEAIQTSWQAGKDLHEYYLKHEIRAEYGKRLILQLVSDTGESRAAIYYSVQLYRNFPIVPAPGQLSLSHFKEVFSIEDPKLRKQLLKEAAEFGLTSRELRRQVKKVRKAVRKKPEEVLPQTRKRTRLIPHSGKLFHYKVKDKTGRGLVLDLGFETYVDPKTFGLGRREAGAVVQVLKDEDGVYKSRKAEATSRELYTYVARLERVVDGDTLWVWVDLGFGVWSHQKLRLRGIDTPELGTVAGKKAKAFVARELGSANFLVIKTTQPDKFGRYLSDVFYLPGESEPGIVVRVGAFLNQVLLNERYAKLY